MVLVVKGIRGDRESDDDDNGNESRGNIVLSTTAKLRAVAERDAILPKNASALVLCTALLMPLQDKPLHAFTLPFWAGELRAWNH